MKLPATAQVTANFSASQVSGCSPLSVQFSDLSTGSPTQWYWDFGNGQTSTDQNPQISYITSGVYSVRLIVKNQSEQSYEEKNNYITVLASPHAAYKVFSGDSGCAPVQAVFQDVSSLFNTTVKSWYWDFGDSTTSTQQNPSHTYTTGEYNVSFTVENTLGCSSTFSKTNAVVAGEKPTADFSASPLDGCASSLRDFKNKSVGKITETFWQFGDGGVSYDRNPEYHYMDTGLFSVRLIASSDGCKDSLTKPDYMHIIGPVAKFASKLNCTDQSTVTFTDHSIGAKSMEWDFGDGSTATNNNPVYSYTKPGVYYVQLIETGRTCNDTSRDTIYIQTSNPKINVSPIKSFYCRNDSIQFFATGYDTTISKNFTWDFGDGSVSIFKGVVDTIFHTYAQSGTFTPKVFIRDKQFCNDSTQLSPSISINGPTAKFQDASDNCTNTAITFLNQSKDAGAAITSWYWSFGDGSTSTLQNPQSFVYAFPGNYQVNLVITDANNCVDSASQDLVIVQTPTVDAGNDAFICGGKSVKLTASGALTYKWQNNGDLSCSNCVTTTAKPKQTTVYYVTGNANGCSAKDSVTITVQQKEIVSIQPDTITFCKGGSIQLNATGADIYTWYPTEGLDNSLIANPVATPDSSTTYNVIGTDKNACFSDNAQVRVIVNPVPSVTFIKNVVQILPNVNYTITPVVTGDIQQYQWQPSDGLSCDNCAQPIANIKTRSTYTVNVINNYGCSDSSKITIIPLCEQKDVFIPNTFSPNNDGINDYFTPRANGELLIKSLTIFNRWGRVVFQKRNFFANNLSDGWDGTYNHELQKSDSYIYVMELQCSGSEEFSTKGSIMLLR